MFDKNDFVGEVKGGTKIIKPDIMVITSNYSIDEIF